MKKVLSALVLALLAGCVASSKSTAADAPPAKPPAPVAPVTAARVSEDGVRSIELPAIAIDLPDAPGKNLIAANCMICHSPQYIMMQPNFPRKTWEASVDKMRKTFGAPIPDALVPEIVEYLVAVRGVKEAAPK